ncbi:MAG: molybdopterin-binding protein [Myxococcota bacterium]
MDSVGILVIGNEVLSGKVEEANARFLIGALRDAGVKLERVVFVRDEVEQIAEDVREMAGRFDHVFTTGGVGGTHDDITMPAVAQAFDVALESHPEMLGLLEAFYGSNMNEALLRMAQLPAGATLHYGEGSRVPVVRVRNVFVLPGAPKFLRGKLPAILPLLSGREIWLGEHFLRVPEEQVADALGAADALREDVEVGSYPQFGDADHSAKITIEGPSAAATSEVFEYLRRAWEGRDVILRSAEPRQVGGPRESAGS